MKTHEEKQEIVNRTSRILQSHRRGFKMKNKNEFNKFELKKGLPTTKENEFKLSEKLHKSKSVWGSWYHPADVKEFIRRLKEELSNPRMFDDAPIAVAENVAEKINNLAGKELI